MPRKKSKGDPTVVSRKRKSKNDLNSQKKKHTDVAAGSGVSLADSIFGSNSSGGSLTSSIFGSDVKKSTINKDLFGSAKKFQRATEKRVEQNTTSIATNGSANNNISKGLLALTGLYVSASNRTNRGTFNRLNLFILILHTFFDLFI